MSFLFIDRIGENKTGISSVSLDFVFEGARRKDKFRVRRIFSSLAWQSMTLIELNRLFQIWSCSRFHFLVNDILQLILLQWTILSISSNIDKNCFLFLRLRLPHVVDRRKVKKAKVLFFSTRDKFFSDSIKGHFIFFKKELLRLDLFISWISQAYASFPYVNQCMLTIEQKKLELSFPFFFVGEKKSQKDTATEEYGKFLTRPILTISIWQSDLAAMSITTIEKKTNSSEY